MGNQKEVFRSDVDVLRGISVTLVVLYHLDVNLFPSGFIGVDIFFVISGYLIARLYAARMSAAEFYERRLRRILPATLVVLIVFYVVSPILFMPFEVEKITGTVIGTLLFSPNMVFWRNNDYFADLDFSPLMHYWSLGVELQYYVLFPMLLYFLKRKNSFIALIAIFSLVGCVVVTNISAKTAFFMMPFRLWEFLLGYAVVPLTIWSVRWRQSYGLWSDLMAMIGLAGLLVLSMLPIPKESYPGVYSMLPAGFGFIYILFGVSDRVLKVKFVKLPFYFFCQLAKISFSVYLIHFPVIFIFKYDPFSERGSLSFMAQVSVLIITGIFSVLNYRFVEQPFRSKKLVSSLGFKRSVSVFYIMCVGLVLIYTCCSYFLGLYQPAKQVILKAMNDRGEWRCSKIQKLLEPFADSCFLNKAKHPVKVIYLVGDSHMDVIKEVFVEEAASKNISIRLNKVRCFLGEYQCSYEHIVKEVKRYGITDVILHGYNYERFNYGDLTQFNSWSEQNGIRVHYIGPIPTYEQIIPGVLYKELETGVEQIERVNLTEFQNSIPFQYVHFERAHRGAGNIFYYHPEILVCTPQCALADHGAVYYFDTNHLTLSGAKILLPIVREIFQK